MQDAEQRMRNPPSGFAVFNGLPGASVVRASGRDAYADDERRL